MILGEAVSCIQGATWGLGQVLEWYSTLTPLSLPYLMKTPQAPLITNSEADLQMQARVGQVVEAGRVAREAEDRQAEDTKRGDSMLQHAEHAAGEEGAWGVLSDLSGWASD